MVPFTGEIVVQSADVALPVKVPVNRILPFEQTEADTGDTVTPLKLLTFITFGPLPVAGFACMLPHEFTANTFKRSEVIFPCGEDPLTDTIIDAVESPEVIVHPVGSVHL